MEDTKFQWVTLDLIRLETKTSGDDPLCYNDKLYILKKNEIFTDQAAHLLQHLHPIFAVRKKKLYYVVVGARTFAATAHSLDPKKKIQIKVLDSRTTEEELQALRYYDLVVSPLILSFAGSASDIYTHCNSANPRQQNNLPQLNSSLRSFAAALGKSPSALCVPKVKATNKSNLDVDAEADK